jgi:hypothetical protein
VTITAADVRVLRISDLLQIADIQQKYVAAVDAGVKVRPFENFATHLLSRRDAWFVELGESGLLYLTNIIPNYSATLDVIFWDRKFPEERRELVLSIVAQAFRLFNLVRLETATPSNNKPFLTRLKQMGFTLEGTLRKGWDTETDAIIHSILREELPCHVIEIPESFLD